MGASSVAAYWQGDRWLRASVDAVRVELSSNLKVNFLQTKTRQTGRNATPKYEENGQYQN